MLITGQGIGYEKGLDENLLLREIETLLREPIRREVVAGFDVDRRGDLPARREEVL